MHLDTEDAGKHAWPQHIYVSLLQNPRLLFICRSMSLIKEVVEGFCPGWFPLSPTQGAPRTRGCSSHTHWFGALPVLVV